jgi:hypothetical protein
VTLELFLTEAVRMPAEALAGMRQSPMWPGLVSLASTLRYDDQVMADGSIPEVSGLAVPTTVLAGTASPPWMREAARALAAALPTGEARELPNQNHNVDPPILAKALTKAFT